jgi:hypothetical protein
MAASCRCGGAACAQAHPVEVHADAADHPPPRAAAVRRRLRLGRAGRRRRRGDRRRTRSGVRGGPGRVQPHQALRPQFAARQRPQHDVTVRGDRHKLQSLLELVLLPHHLGWVSRAGGAGAAQVSGAVPRHPRACRAAPTAPPGAALGPGSPGLSLARAPRRRCAPATRRRCACRRAPWPGTAARCRPRARRTRRRCRRSSRRPAGWRRMGGSGRT